VFAYVNAGCLQVQ